MNDDRSGDGRGSGSEIGGGVLGEVDSGEREDDDRGGDSSCDDDDDDGGGGGGVLDGVENKERDDEEGSSGRGRGLEREGKGPGTTLR